MKPTSLKAALVRGDRLKTVNVQLRKQIAALRMEALAKAKAAYAAGSASAFAAIYHSMGDDMAIRISDAVANRGRRSKLDPAIAEMVHAGVAELMKRAGLK